jgi:hypothetical protein
MVKHLDGFGNEIEVISSRGRFWYVKNTKTGKCFSINKNNVTCIEKSNTLSNDDDQVKKTKKDEL